MATEAEILAMKAGRELDALVAEVIFGYRVYRYAARDWQVYCPGLHTSARRMHKYSQTGSAALLVVEKMPPPFQIHRCLDKRWQVVFGFDTWIKPRIEDKTAPEAICKAALLAKIQTNSEAER